MTECPLNFLSALIPAKNGVLELDRKPFSYNVKLD